MARRRTATTNVRPRRRRSRAPSTLSIGVRRFEPIIRQRSALGPRIDQILGRPAVEVVLRHARLRELLPAVVLTGGEGAEQRVAADLLVAARVVDLVELVAAAELSSHCVPQELHELDALDGVDAARAP